jgi:ABC-2 type transport system permease protein
MTAFTGTRTLIRFILRRDRLRLLIWILGIVGFFTMVAASFPSIYPTEQERQARATLMSNPTAMAFRGPGYGFDDYTYGAILAHELMGYATIAAALMSIFLVVRHTRAEEEHGRLELIRSSVVGRYAPPTAALTVVVAANIIIALLFTLVLPLVPGDYSLAGSLAFGLGVGSVGIVFAGIGAIAAQLTEYGRGASSMGVIVLGVTYLLRAIGDVQENALSWLSPVGWAQATRAYVDERWWPLLLPAVFFVAVLAAVFVLISRRDVAAGILPQRPGPANASAMTVNPFGFALRQVRGGIIGWGIGLAVVGVAFGSLIGDIEAFIDDNPQLEDFLGGIGGASLVDGFIALIVMVMAFMATGFAVQAALRVRSEETEGRAEALMATALSRVRWLGSYLLAAMLGSLVILFVGTGALGAVAAADQNDTALLYQTLGAGAANLPAVWLVVGLAAMVFGVLPRLLVIPWLVLVYGVFIGLFGDMLQVPAWMNTLSPFEHVPELPGGDVTYLPLALVGLVALVLLIAGLYGFRNRDLEVA